jgi:hypothetical protein
VSINKLIMRQVVYGQRCSAYGVYAQAGSSASSTKPHLCSPLASISRQIKSKYGMWDKKFNTENPLQLYIADGSDSVRRNLIFTDGNAEGI